MFSLAAFNVFAEKPSEGIKCKTCEPNSLRPKDSCKDSAQTVQCPMGTDRCLTITIPISGKYIWLSLFCQSHEKLKHLELFF